MRSLLPVFYILFVCVGCKQDSETDLAELDLMPYGMPIVIRAPENPEIKSMDLVMSKDVSVVKGTDYNVQIFESDASIRDVAEIKNQLLRDIKRNPYFASVILDEPAGFIYETQVDSNYVNYGFRYIRIQGDKEYIFQQGLRGKFSREAVESMYNAVK